MPLILIWTVCSLQILDPPSPHAIVLEELNLEELDLGKLDRHLQGAEDLEDLDLEELDLEELANHQPRAWDQHY